MLKSVNESVLDKSLLIRRRRVRSGGSFAFKQFKVLDYSVAFVVVVILGSLSVVDGHEHLHLRVPSARIILNSFETGIVRTITEKVNHEVVLTVPTSFAQAYLLECNATYPVEWNYIGEGAPRTTADVGRQFKDFYNVNTYTYQTILHLHQLEELQSGRYICRGTNPEQEKLQIHYDLFVPGNGSQVLISNAEKKIFVPESKLLTSLPCEVTDPSLTVNLYKGDDWGIFQKVDTNDSIIFRPRKGFILKLHELPSPFGTYMCATPDNKRRRKLHLIPERYRDKYEGPNANGQGSLNGQVPVQMSYDYEYNRMLCCSGQSFIPRLQWANCNSVLDCKIKSVCFEEDRCGNTLEMSDRWRDPGPVPAGCVGWKLRDGLQGDHGILKCSTPGVTQYQPYLLNRGHIFTDFEIAPPSETILTLTKTSLDPMYLGSEVEYHCNSTRFYFAYGIRWAFKRGNDDIEFVDDSSSYVVRDKYPLTSHRRQTTFRILHSDVKAIICFVPIANSPTEWRTVSLPISIRDSLNIPSSPQPHTILPPQQQDYLNNRLPHSHSHHNQQLMEPFSTSRPQVVSILNKHNLNHLPPSQIIDPTPSVDIADIIAPSENPPPPRFSHSVPMIPIETLSQVDDRDYLYSPTIPVVKHHHSKFPKENYHPFSKESYTFPKESKKDNHFAFSGTKEPYHHHHSNTDHHLQYDDQSHREFNKNEINRNYHRHEEPEIITEYNNVPYKHSHHNQPQSNSFEHGDNKQRYHHHFPSSTTQRPLPHPRPTSANPHMYTTPRHEYLNKEPQIITSEDYYNAKPAHKNYKFPTSSRESFREDPNVYSTSTMTPKPFSRYYSDRGGYSDSFEIRTTPMPPSRPVIQYNSQEKQYSLRDPGRVPHPPQRKWTAPLPSPSAPAPQQQMLDHYSRPTGPERYPQDYYQTTSAPIRIKSQKQDHRERDPYYSSEIRRSNAKSSDSGGRTTVVEAKFSIVPEDLDAAPYNTPSEDYYMSSLIAKERRNRVKTAPTASSSYPNDQNGAASSAASSHQYQFHNLRNPHPKSSREGHQEPLQRPQQKKKGSSLEQRERESLPTYNYEVQRPYSSRRLTLEAEEQENYDNYYLQRYGENKVPVAEQTQRKLKKVKVQPTSGGSLYPLVENIKDFSKRHTDTEVAVKKL